MISLVLFTNLKNTTRLLHRATTLIISISRATTCKPTPEMADDDIKERTKKMMEEQRRKAVEHEKTSRANHGKAQFPLSLKLKQALPLVAIVVALYSWSFYYTKKRSNLKKDITQPDRVLPDVRDIFAPEEKTGEKGPQLPELVADFDLPDDGLLLDDTNKKW